MAICEKFLKKGEPIVSTEGRNASADVQRKSAGFGKKRLTLPIVLLVNGGSASASEIVSGCLQDLGRAVLVGETTFGKGSVQSVIPLQDGAAIRLTTAKYYTPGKQVIHERGIEPTIRAALPQEQERLVALQRREEQLDESEKAEIAGFRDAQLERASDTLKAVVLYAARGAALEQPAPSGSRK